MGGKKGDQKRKRTQQMRVDEMEHPAFTNDLEGDIEFEGIPGRPGQGEKIKPFEVGKKDQV
ncbi:hypothetical protein J2S00_001650 [Caldalkalibacillus uzonensis]|uniref:Uncharacterized protein n=1 Tax=Caldalkalibacillus uzonensis TaxID=353224 RepID=A0ABU0CR63_9BACI|nr:hypothetical protein [Caldalkalibacillus uzonensis]MDQ0338864.1 hypothetical protein [Caldalkalibacillus uzonensis]